MIITEVSTRRRRRTVVAGALALAAGILIAGCAGSPIQPNPPSPQPSSAGAGEQSSNPDVALCRTYLAASGDARAPLPAIRTEAVLVPTIDFIELGANQIATRGVGARSPIIAAAMREVVAAQGDLDSQGHQKLPAGADLNATTVMLNPDRLAAALDAADLACKPLLSTGPKPA